jgi:hypothetical protein
MLAGVVTGMVLILGGPTAGRAQSQEKTSLWKVSSDANTVYLLGSIHLLTEKDYPLNAKMEQAFQEAEIVVFEVDPDSLQAPSLQTYILQNVMYGEGKTLESELGDSVYAIASARAESLGIDLGPMAGFKPWFVSITLALAKMQGMGFDPELGVEMYFAKKAKAEGKKVLGLETAKYQLDLFATLTAVQQRDLLLHTLHQLSYIEKELATILAAWKDGELEGLENTLNKSFKEFPEIQERLVTQRNRNWVAEIDSFLGDDRTYLVVVGVGHMPGGEGLIELLKKKGYSIEQL